MQYLGRLYGGRIGRKHYVLGLLLLFIVLVLLGLALDSEDYYESTGASLILLVIYAAFIFYQLSLHVRRFHDLGKTGWAVLVFVIPLVNLITLIWLLVAKGQDEGNKYGQPTPGNADFLQAIFSPKAAEPVGVVAQEIQSAQTPSDDNAGVDRLFCHSCGSRIDLDSRFCARCGAKVLKPRKNI